MLNSIFRFGGKLEESLKNYDKIANNGSLLSDLNEVNNKIYSIEKEFNSDTLEQNKKRILQNISDKIKYYARIFGAEYCNDNILFDIENLTLQFSSSSITSQPYLLYMNTCYPQKNITKFLVL